LSRIECFLRADECDAAAGDDAFLDCCTGCVQGVFNAGFLFLNLRLGGCTDVDDCDAAGGELLLHATK
jgi:hypothetical protein